MKVPAATLHQLRLAAEAQLARFTSPTRPAETLLHELQVHQIELEMQNEELRKTQLALEESRDRYVDLYEFAPVGYFSLNEAGRIDQINLTGATLQGELRNKLVQAHFSRYVKPEDSDRWYRFFRSAMQLQEEPQQSCELALQRPDGRRLQVRLDCARPELTTSTLRVTLTDITERQQAEEALRIAAAAFECQEGILVLNAELKILRANQAFTQITGYAQRDVEGRSPALLRSKLQPVNFYEAAWAHAQNTGRWQGDMWHRRQNGEDYPTRVTISAVHNAQGQVSHYVVNLTDATSQQLREQQRLLNETAHRDTLVNEVHHRIKNNLQGIMSLLRQFAQKHPETAHFLHEAIGQVQGIAVIHGLQGRTVTASVNLGELTGAIAHEIQTLWQTPVMLDIAPLWPTCRINEKEAVPIALILNELILNAVKHGGNKQGRVNISLRHGPQPDGVQVEICNVGQLPADGGQTRVTQSGLNLISALMPLQGARLIRKQQGDRVITVLTLDPPVISHLPKEPA